MEKELLTRKENYLVNARLFFDGLVLDNIPCKVYLPERIYGKPWLVINPSSEDYYKLMQAHVSSIYAEVVGFSGEVELIIKSDELYFHESSIRYGGKSLSESLVYCSPEGLDIFEPFKGGVSETVLVSYWLTPNSFITPVRVLYSHPDGAVYYKVFREVEYEIDDLFYSFKSQYDSKTEDNDDFVQWAYLVAEHKTSESHYNYEKIIKDNVSSLDDFLLLVSFASRHKTFCTGWEASDVNGIYKHYRGNYNFSKLIKNESTEYVVEPSEFPGFIRVAAKSFLDYRNKLSLRSAINSVLNVRESTVEKSFLSMFSALETLILDFRKDNDFEYVLNREDWSKLRGVIQDAIKRAPGLNLEKPKRAKIYTKLNELNRVSLKDAYEYFCVYYSIDTEDLWPVFGKSDFSGLSEVRNRLVHGDTFSKELDDALINAQFHMGILLERVILRVLNWDVSSSNVSRANMKIYDPDILEFLKPGQAIKQYFSKKDGGLL